MSDRPPPHVFLMVKCFLGLFLLVGVSSLLYGGWLIDRANESKSWPTVDATVLTSELTTSHSTDSDSGPTYGATITYTYIVKGTTYQSDRVSLGEYSSSDISHAESILDHYPVNAIVAAYYDPRDPASAVLETGVTGGIYIVLVVGGGFTVMASVFLLIIRRVQRHGSSTGL